MKLFPLHFRDHVMPKLRAAVNVQAFLIACGSATYSEGHAEVFAVARRYGALYLPDNRLADLQDWIATALVDGIDAAERRVDEIEAQHAIADPIQHYDMLAEQSRDPEAMRWTFAAICPEYRAHLIAGRRGAR